MLNIHFLVESSPKTFELLEGLIDKLVGAQEETIDSARIYCISALLRMLRMNVESLQLWKKFEEPVNSVAIRTVHGKVDWIDEKSNYISQLKSYLMQLLQEKAMEKKESMKIFVEKKEEKESSKKEELVTIKENVGLKIEDDKEDETILSEKQQTEEEIIKILEKDKLKMKKKEQQGGDDEKSDIVDHDSIHEYESDDFVIVSQLSNLDSESNTISLEVASILCSGFTLFYPTFQEQEEFFLDHLKNIQYPLKRAILNKVLKKMIEDNTLFVSFWINGVGFAEDSLKFIDTLVDFCKNYTLGVLNNDFKKGSPVVHEIILQIQQLMLRWQNQVLKQISPLDVSKVKSSVSTSPKLSSDDSILFFDYSSLIFDSFTEIMDEANSICSELKTFEENKQKIDTTLKDSLIGNLFFPLIHGFSKLFWKKGSSHADFGNLSEFVLKYIYSLLKSISTYNGIFGNIEIDPNWYIIESNHPYKPGKQDIDVEFDSNCVGVITKIDPKSRTALRPDGSYDNLRISTKECELPSQSLAFGGKGSSIPSNPLLTNGNSIKYTFDGQSSEWGVRMSSLPLKEINWMVELEKTLIWMTTRIASSYMSGIPVKPEELDESSWINNPLFKVGFDEINQHNTFLQDFIQEKGDSVHLIKFMNEYLINEKAVFNDNESIISSERCLIATLIKHTNSSTTVVELTKQIIENPKEVKVPSTILTLWKFSRQIRMWMAGKKQREKIDFDVIYAQILTNCQFLLLLSPPNEEDFLVQGQVYKFVTSKCDIVQLKSLLDLRKFRAQSRLTGCKIFLDLVESIEAPSIRSIVVHAFHDVLQYSSLNYHILNNVIPCGSSLKKNLLQTTRKLYFNFLKDLKVENESALVNGLLREILGTVFIKFTVIDIEWIIEYELINKLTSFMFDYPKVEVSNFMINPSSVEEKKQISLKSWKIFKVLAIRIALIVEKWDEEQTTIEVDNRESVFNSLNNLVEKIFAILFEQLESFVKGSSIQVHTLTEILAIISTLSSTECGLKNSSSKRFLKILLPMLRVNNPKCQEISLQLAGKLIQNSEYSNDLNKLLISLFEYLGSHVIFSVLGKDYFKLQSQNIKVTKNIFHIIRKLISHDEWKIQIQNMISENLVKITKILKNGILKDIEEPLRFLLSVATVIVGLNYIPNPGESVKIFLNNRWEEAKLLNLNEHTLSVKIKKNEIYDVDSEFVKVFTNDHIENFEFKNIDDLITFVMICGDYLENNQIDSVEIKLLLNYLWMRSIQIMSLWPQEKRHIDQLIYQFERFIEFSKYDTGRLYGKIPKFDACTYTWTGPQFFRQYYYSCKTCGMGKKQAVCAFCAKTCHAGHELQHADSGDFYCDCGVGEGKYPCKSLKKSNPEKIPSIEKLEALGMRYQSLMPFYHGESSTKGKTPKKFHIDNGYYETNGRIGYKNNNMIYSMLVADPVECSFYFEVKVLRINPKDTIAIGFTPIPLAGKPWTDILGSSSSYHLNSGHLYTGQVIHKVCFGPTCNQNDIFGFGYSKETATFFVTKNGEHLGNGFTFVKDKPYHPMLILKGDAIVSYNFGEQNFVFAIDSIFRSLTKKSVSPLEELKNLGYTEEACSKALKKHPNDLNAAAAVLHNSKNRSLRDELAEKLEPMGFDIEICKRALAIAGDDVDNALNILLEGTIDLSLVQSEEKKASLQLDSGTSLLGSNISQNEFDNLIMKSMLQYIDTPLNLNCVYTVDFQKLNVGDFVVVNPEVIENEHTPLSVFKGRIGVISKKDTNGVNLNIFDQETKTVKTILLYAKHLLAAPFEMTRASVLDENLSNYKALASLYVRKILTSCLTNTNLLPTSLSPSKMFRALKILFIDQYNHQTLSFMNDDVKLPENIKNMMKSFESINVKTMDGEIPVFDYVAEEALNEMKTFKDNSAHYRKFEYTSDMNQKLIFVKFFNATNLYINFVKCDLGVGDSFTLWNDKYEKFEIKKFTGPVSLPRFFTVAGNSFYFKFKANELKEGAGFKFYITPTGYQFTEPVAITHPNLGLATTICKNASSKIWATNKLSHEAFKTALEFVLVPYAPYKGTVVDALCNMSIGVYKTKPSLDLLKHFRLELEDLYDEYLKHYEIDPRKYPIFHRLIDFFSFVRRLLTSDLCSSVFPSNALKKTHFYSIEAEDNQQFKLCTSCAIIVGGDSKYHDQEKKKCLACLARQYNWGDLTFSNLVPIKTIKMNPSEWFEHVNWVDQVAIVRHLCESFLTEKTLPDWVYYEAALETKKKLVYKSSPHPYTVINDQGTINIPGAKTLYVSFDKHSKTHKSEKIVFKGKNDEDIGSFSGDELRDKTIIVHGNTLSYEFVAQGGDHECLCNHCGTRVNGVRYHCFGKGTPVLMANGYEKNIEDIKINDEVLGPDSNPRKVINITNGRDVMYRITQKSKSKKDLVYGLTEYICNSRHLLVVETPRFISDIKQVKEVKTGILKEYVEYYKLSEINVGDRIIMMVKLVVSSFSHQKWGEKEAKKQAEIFRQQILKENNNEKTFKWLIEARDVEYIGTKVRNATYQNLSPILIEHDNFRKTCNQFGNLFKNNENISKMAWLFGLWIGDGSSIDSKIAVNINDKDEIKRIQDYSEDLGLIASKEPYQSPSQIEMKSLTGIIDIHSSKEKFNKNGDKSHLKHKKINNVFWSVVKAYGLGNNTEKLIPNSFHTEEIFVREWFLAGLIDSDGYLHNQMAEISTIYDKVRNGIVKIAKSLGIPVSVHYKENYIDKFGVNHQKSYTITLSMCNSLQNILSKCSIERKKMDPPKIIEYLQVPFYFNCEKIQESVIENSESNIEDLSDDEIKDLMKEYKNFGHSSREMENISIKLDCQISYKSINSYLNGSSKNSSNARKVAEYILSINNLKVNLNTKKRKMDPLFQYYGITLSKESDKLFLLANNCVVHNCTECDDYDLCSKCMRKENIHDETHIFLKVRRPVDCVPAGLPHLYTHRWSETSQFRGSTHSGVKCDNCNAFPIKGIRYMCENCQDFNLCSTCAQEEYKYHDRMHVFLRVVRPLPPKKQLPPNALPYGLVYEKELDTHWGYLFSVSSSENNTSYSDKLISEIKDSMEGWTDDLDAQLVQYVEKCCNGWQSLEWGGLLPTNSQLVSYPKLSTPNIKAIRYRFIILKLLNRKISRVLHLTDVANLESLNSLGHLISKMREKIFSSVKMDVWSHTLAKTVIDIAKPISLKLNRQKAAERVEDKLLFARNSVFYQTFEQLQAMDVRILSRKKAAWKVTFLGESADDYGGPFRESLTQMCQELQTDQLDMLIPVPNSKVDGGKNGDKFIPNPSANTDQHLKLFRFLGMILGVGLLDALILPIDFPSIVWKHFVHQPLDEYDLEAIDTDLYNSLNNLRTIEKQGITEDNFGDYIFNNFVAQASDGTEIELVKNGKMKPVTFKNRFNYVDKVIKFRLFECEAQIKAICEGLYSIIPHRFFNIFTWDELELLCCGRPEIDPAVLKKHTIYEGYNQNSKEIKDFWAIFNEFTNEERSIYLKFVWGRARLPISEEGYSHPMKIQKLERTNPDKYLPLSHTCFFSIELPSYSSRQVMKEKLLYAINNCKAIDTDATTVANESRNMNQ